ncbi:MAG: FAD-dependent monooxygenase [Nocardioides alkalitolerans]
MPSPSPSPSEEDHVNVDVVVVGFGPTGAAAANLLGQLGVRALVVERDRSGARDVLVRPDRFVHGTDRDDLRDACVRVLPAGTTTR